MAMPRRRTEGLSIQEVDGGLLVLDLAGNRIHQLNATATLIWQCCDATTSSEAIAQRVADGFEVEPPIALSDVLRTLEDLRSAGLVTQA